MLILFECHDRNIMVTYITPDLGLKSLHKEIRDICKFDQQQHFTIKWIDEDGDLIIFPYFCPKHFFVNTLT